MHPVSFRTPKCRGGELPSWCNEKATRRTWHRFWSQWTQNKAYGAGAAMLMYQTTEAWDVTTHCQSLLTICHLLGQWVFHLCRVPCVAILILKCKHFSWTAGGHKWQKSHFLPTPCMGYMCWLLFPAWPLFGEIASLRLKWSWVSYCGKRMHPSQS